ncbi:hypothetical protein D3C73_559420 [compost metagenome]
MHRQFVADLQFIKMIGADEFERPGATGNHGPLRQAAQDSACKTFMRKAIGQEADPTPLSQSRHGKLLGKRGRKTVVPGYCQRQEIVVHAAGDIGFQLAEKDVVGKGQRRCRDERGVVKDLALRAEPAPHREISRQHLV